MKLHVIYRSYGGENLKNRPAFYSKDVALASLLRAVDIADVQTELLFLNDGPIPQYRLGVMEGAGESVSVQCGSNRRSYGVAIRLPGQRSWDPTDLVWLSEDDYLYSPDALAELVTGATQMPAADYFALYCDLEITNVAGRRPEIVRQQPYHEVSSPTGDLARRSWYRAAASTSTFGGRVAAMREDERMLRLCSYSGGAWDRASCLTYQGFQPYPWANLWRDGAAESRLRMARGIRTTARGVVRAGLNVTALARRPRQRRRLAAVGPNPITHMELPYLASGTPWSAIAADTRAWAISRGMHLSAELTGGWN